MLKSGDVSFDLGFERGRMSATGYVAKISMLRLNIGSGMLRLSSCMLRLGLRLSILSCMLRLGPGSGSASSEAEPEPEPENE